jgi:hypothetical protein
MNTTPTTIKGTLSHEPDEAPEFSFGYLRRDSGQANSEREVYPLRPLPGKKSRLAPAPREGKKTPRV